MKITAKQIITSCFQADTSLFMKEMKAMSSSMSRPEREFE